MITTGNTYYLLKDVDSHIRKGFKYAKAGEQVKVISISHHVAIVESEKGVRMPVVIGKEL